MAEKNKKKKLAIGIDLGTTNSAVGVWWKDKVEVTENREGNRITPSYGYYTTKEELIGRVATKRLTTDPRNVLFDAKRLLAERTTSEKLNAFREFWPFEICDKKGDFLKKVYYLTSEGKLIPPEKVSTEILKSLLSDVTRRYEVKEDTEVEAVITVPAYFSMAQKRATMEAADAAGITVKQLLSEPVAAAISYQYETKIAKFKDGETVFVFDLGGGTFDVTIMKIEKNSYRVIALGGDSHLGGRDFDNILARILEDALKGDIGEETVNKLRKQDKYRYRLLELARTTKEALTTTQNEVVALSDLHPTATKGFEVEVDNFEQAAEHLITKIKDCCDNTLKDSKLSAAQIDHVVLVGGSSKMACVKNIISKIFGEDKGGTKNLNADEAIAKGATVLAAKLLDVTSDTEIMTLNFQDALPLSLGIEVAGNKFKSILNRNSPIPSKNNIILSTSEDFQHTAMVPIYEGRSENIVEDAYIAEIEINGLPRKTAGEVKIEITLQLDINGILKAEARIMDTNVVVKTDINYESTFECK